MSPVPDLPDPDAIAAAIATCPSVAGLSGGVAGEIATYLPGRRVAGVRTSDDSVEVHVIARYGTPLHAVESEVRAAVTAAVGDAARVDVVLADVEDPFAPSEDEEPPKELEAGPAAAASRSHSTEGGGPAAGGMAVTGTSVGAGPTGGGAATTAVPPASTGPSGSAGPPGPALPTAPAS